MAAAMLVGCATGDVPKPDKPQAGTRSPAVDRSEPADGNLATTPAKPPKSSAAKVADRFAHAWTQRDLPAREWHRGVARWCTAELGELLRTTDPGNVPASKVIGEPKRVKGGRTPAYAVATSGGKLTVSLAVREQGWRVSDIDFERAATK